MKFDFQNATLFWFYSILIVITGEAVIELLKNKTPEFKNTLANIGVGFSSLLVEGLVPLFNFGFLSMAIYNWVPWHLPVTPLTTVLAFIVVDLHFYWSHRLDHQMRILWTLHQIHHSSSHFNLSVLLRRSFVKNLFNGFRFLFLAGVGFHPLQTGACFIVLLLYLGTVHLEWVGKLGWLEKFTNTPSNHRVHHGYNGPYVNKNFAAVFVLWDKIFGTYQEELEPIQFGTSDQPSTNNPIMLQLIPIKNLFQGFFKLKSFRARMIWLFGSPNLKISDGKLVKE